KDRKFEDRKIMKKLFAGLRTGSRFTPHRNRSAFSTLRRYAFLCASAFCIPFTHGQLLVEHFAYGNGNLGASGVGDTVWSGGDSPNISLVVSNTAGLSGAGLGGASGNGVIFNGSTFKKKAAPFTAQSGNGNALYCSFLLQIQNAPTGTKAFL